MRNVRNGPDEGRWPQILVGVQQLAEFTKAVDQQCTREAKHEGLQIVESVVVGGWSLLEDGS